MTHAHPLVEDETAAVPAALVRRHLLQIRQGAAPQMHDLLAALMPQERGRFFATEAAGATGFYAKRVGGGGNRAGRPSTRCGA